MSNVVALPAAGQAYPAAQLALIRRTVASDCSNDEFDLFVTVAKRAGLDPFRKQISALVFNKNKPDKRRMAIVTTIDGLRVIAARSGRYRPDEDEPEYTASPDLKSDTNPLGLEKAVVRIWIADAMKAGAWKRVTGVAYWDEFAPVSDEWKEDEQTGRRRPTGRKVLDTGGNWGRMPGSCWRSAPRPRRSAAPSRRTCPACTRARSWTRRARVNCCRARRSERR